MEKQKKRLPDSLAVICGLLVLLALGIAALIAHGGEFSEWERRYLANRPCRSIGYSFLYLKADRAYISCAVP